MLNFDVESICFFYGMVFGFFAATIGNFLDNAGNYLAERVRGLRRRHRCDVSGSDNIRDVDVSDPGKD